MAVLVLYATDDLIKKYIHFIHMSYYSNSIQHKENKNKNICQS